MNIRKRIETLETRLRLIELEKNKEYMKNLKGKFTNEEKYKKELKELRKLI